MTSSTPLNPPALTSPTIDLLILGSGWTSTFLLPLLSTPEYSHITYISTTRSGSSTTLPFTFDSELEGDEANQKQFEGLPRAKTIVIIFPIRGAGGSKKLVKGYEGATGARDVRWIQLGSTGIYDGGPTLQSTATTTGTDEKRLIPSSSFEHFKWTDRFSKYDKTNARVIAEDELMAFRDNSYILNLSGLWGGTRDPINWISRVAPTKASLATKSSLHLIHGQDVARAILAVHLSPPSYSDTSSDQQAKAKGKRYLLTDLRIYDWWDLISSFASSPDSVVTQSLTHHGRWVLELMEETKVRALPRTPEQLGRALDSRDFWRDFGLTPVMGRVERSRI